MENTIRYVTQDNAVPLRTWPTWITRLGNRLCTVRKTPGSVTRVVIDIPADGEPRWRIETVGKWENEK